MTPQDHASRLLRVWQQRRSLPPRLRLVDAPPLVPDMGSDYDAIISLVAQATSDV